ncbi:hypothetical protein PM082_012651 [Marasmius tenuissimus]|nr:hypothetical protein PM082_012651 [Marasmius tenuissimus]
MRLNLTLDGEDGAELPSWEGWCLSSRKREVTLTTADGGTDLSSTLRVFTMLPPPGVHSSLFLPPLRT